jgi:hypothetical protein
VSWLCKWCGIKFTPRHQSRALKHVLIILCGDIAICTSAIPKNYEDQYRALCDKNVERSLSRKRSHTHIDDALMTKQSLAIANLLEKRGVVVSGGASSSLSMIIPSLPSVQSSVPMTVGAGSRYSSMTTYNSMRGSTPFGLSSQPSISASIQNMDIRKSHNAIVEMAIADFFHCENIPDVQLLSHQGLKGL